MLILQAMQFLQQGCLVQAQPSLIPLFIRGMCRLVVQNLNIVPLLN
jgi:hypothetical protein